MLFNKHFQIMNIWQIQGQMTHFWLTLKNELDHVFHWNVAAYNFRENWSFQGQITIFRLTDFAHIRTWPVLPRDLPISKVLNRSHYICSSYRCNTSIRVPEPPQYTPPQNIIIPLIIVFNISVYINSNWSLCDREYQYAIKTKFQGP